MKKLMYYLEGKTPVPTDDYLKFVEMTANKDRHVALDKIGGNTISTVFIGLDYHLCGEPQLFETMVFSPDGDVLKVDRCGTWEQAENMHKRMVTAFNNGAKKQKQ